MGLTTTPPVRAPGTPMTGLGAPVWLLRTGWATLVANILLVVTGGAVRITGSGLGCPTWPHCNTGSFTPHGAMNLHKAIEFGNRTLTFVLTAVAVLTLVCAWKSGRRDLRALAVGLALAIPAQAVIGGITVLTDLNPWVVSFHLLLSLGIISLSVVYLARVGRPRTGAPPGTLSALAWTTYAVTWVVLYLGTVVTGSGPHAGDANAPRNGLDPAALSQAHADVVFALLGLSVALLLVLHASGAPRVATRAATVLVAAEVVQGLIGFAQYFTGLPGALVGLHMLGAALIAAAVTWVLLEVRRCR